MTSTVYWVVEEFNGKFGKKARNEPVAVFRTLREASVELKKRKQYNDVRLQSVLRADI